MTVDYNITAFKKNLMDYVVENLEKKPKENYVNILILRELKSAARFTTDGTQANSATIRIGTIEETVGKLFGRKQVASDRRKAKALQRTLITEEMQKVVPNWNGCTMKVNEMCQKCPECVLFGSAASDEGMSITSRVMYDEAYTIRAISAIVEEFFQNAPGDDYAKTPTPGIREPDFFKEGTLFPCAVTLKDATIEEVMFFLNITDRNSRYGATGTRFGKVQNHILGVYAGHREGPSSLEITREIALKLAGKKVIQNGTELQDELKNVMYSDTLDVNEIKDLSVKVYEELSKIHRISYNKVDETKVSKILSELTDDVVKEALVNQIDKIQAFISA
jgi:CRISPR-associated protein Csc2